MPTTTATDTSDIRNEFNALRDEVSQFIGVLKDYEKDRARETKEKISAEVSHLRTSAKDKLKGAKKAGDKAAKEVEGTIRDHPITSLAVAFAVGFIASKFTDSKH